MTNHEKALRLSKPLSGLEKHTLEYLIETATDKDVTLINIGDIQDLLLPKLKEIRDKDSDLFMELAAMAVATLIRDKILWSVKKAREKQGEQS